MSFVEQAILRLDASQAIKEAAAATKAVRTLTAAARGLAAVAGTTGRGTAARGMAALGTATGTANKQATTLSQTMRRLATGTTHVRVNTSGISGAIGQMAKLRSNASKPIVQKIVTQHVGSGAGRVGGAGGTTAAAAAAAATAPRRHGYGGRYSISSGFHGIAHAGAHAWIDDPKRWGQVAGAVAGAHMVGENVREAAARQEAELALRIKGLTQTQMGEADNLANLITRKFGNIGKTEALRTVGDAIPIFGDFEHAAHGGAQAIAYVESAFRRLGIAGTKAREEAIAAVKSAEISGKTSTEELKQRTQEIVALKAAYGDTVSIETYLKAQRQAGTAYYGLSEGARYGMLGALVQENSSNAGTMLARVYRAVHGNKKLTEREVAAARSVGMYDEKNQQLRAPEIFDKNPTAWVDLVAEGLARKQGKMLSDVLAPDGNFTDEFSANLDTLFGRMFADSNASRAMSQMAHQRSKLAKDVEFVSGILRRYGTMEKGLKAAQTWNQSVDVFQAGLGNLQTAMGRGLTDALVRPTEWVGQAMTRMATHLDRQPALGTAAMIGAGGAAIWAGGRLMQWISGGAALQTAGIGLQGAAASLSRAAFMLSGGRIQKPGATGFVAGGGRGKKWWSGAKAGGLVGGIAAAATLLSLMSDPAAAAEAAKLQSNTDRIRAVLGGAGLGGLLGIVGGPMGMLVGALSGGMIAALSAYWDRLNGPVQKLISRVSNSPVGNWLSQKVDKLADDLDKMMAEPGKEDESGVKRMLDLERQAKENRTKKGREAAQRLLDGRSSTVTGSSANTAPPAGGAITEDSQRTASDFDMRREFPKLKAAVDTIHAAWNEAANAIKTGGSKIGSAWDAAIDVLKSGGSQIGDFWSTIKNWFRPPEGFSLKNLVLEALGLKKPEPTIQDVNEESERRNSQSIWDVFAGAPGPNAINLNAGSVNLSTSEIASRMMSAGAATAPVPAGGSPFSNFMSLPRVLASLVLSVALTLALLVRRLLEVQVPLLLELALRSLVKLVVALLVWDLRSVAKRLERYRAPQLALAQQSVQQRRLLSVPARSM